jgi:glycyl-tRNA synthetase alpha subunit
MATGSYEKCKHYIETHSPLSETLPHRVHHYPCITISRETGSGVKLVCEELIKILEYVSEESDIHWTFFDQGLIEKVLEDHNLPKQVSKYMEEEKYKYISGDVDVLLGIHPSQWTLLHKMTESILQLARMGKVINVGRGATVITAKLKNAFHVRLVAPIQDRVKHIMEIENLSEKEAEAYIKQKDKGRREYIKSSFSKNIEDLGMYHMVVNTGLMSYKESAEIIASAVMKKFPNLYRVEAT